MYSQQRTGVGGKTFRESALSAILKPALHNPTQLARRAPPQIWLGAILSRARLRPQLRKLFSNVVRIAVLRINFEDAFQVLLSQSRLCRLGVSQSEVIVIGGAVRLFVLRRKLYCLLKQINRRLVDALLVKSPTQSVGNV